jgi:hypothetical protein
VEDDDNSTADHHLAAVDDFVWVRYHRVQVLYPVLANYIQ